MSMKVELIRIQNVLNFSKNMSHGFHWSVLSAAPRNTFKQKILKMHFIKIMVPFLNSQMNNDTLTLFRDSVT